MRRRSNVAGAIVIAALILAAAYTGDMRWLWGILFAVVLL